jgi:hypothetical protein
VQEIMAEVPVFEFASVREFSVVDLPEEGLPTRPIRGSRGMVMFCKGYTVYERSEMWVEYKVTFGTKFSETNIISSKLHTLIPYTLAITIRSSEP